MDKLIRLNSKATFDCQAISNPNAKVYWQKLTSKGNYK